MICSEPKESAWRHDSKTFTYIANAILPLRALFAVYEAYARGGDTRMVGISAAKFLLLGLILSNCDSILRSVNGAFNQVAAAISPNDWANNWMLQGNQCFNGLGNASWFNLVVSSIVALISVLVQLIAAIIFPMRLLVFTILYCLYGASPFGPSPRSCARSGLGSQMFSLANGLPSTSSAAGSPER